MEIQSSMQQSTINPMAMKSTTWSFEEDKVFESALLSFADGMAQGWHKIAEVLPGKTAAEVRAHYEVLLHDVNAIESGRVSFSYSDDDDNKSVSSLDSDLKTNKTGKTGKGSKRGDKERKKGTPWTKDEHRNFLEGLRKYGRGDWRSIARNCVITRTSTQVASHAQKYFIRQAAERKERKRASIHDITTTDTTTMPVQPPPMPPQPAHPNIYGGQGGGIMVGPQMGGFGYQQNFGYLI
uniref:transcription factor SRM1-like n=1 Tax=Erigeron canadensis TaxID=72917 RepID=UPI001CB957B5|nr:transcription factor SRM1-like [Erigeron canadensis]